MEISLPEDLQKFVYDQVRTGRFSSEQPVIREALEYFKDVQRVPPGDQPVDPWIGSMREDADLLDEIVEEAMVIREERPWRLIGGCATG